MSAPTNIENGQVEYGCPQCAAIVRLPGYADVAVCPSCGSTLTREAAQAAAPAVKPVATPAALQKEPGVASPEVSPPRSGLSVDAPEEQVLRSVRCSQCAGPLTAREGQRLLVCGHCGVRMAVREHGGFSRWYLPARIERLEAVAAAATWLEDHPGISKRARAASLAEARLVYVPIWEHRSLVAGWEFGYKLRTRYELVGDEEREWLDLRLAREGVEEPYLQERRYFEAATDLSALGATRPRITGRELMLPLLAGELDPSSAVLEARGSAAEAAAAGRKAALLPVSGASSPDSHMFALRESTALLYYPLWLLRYQVGNRFYRIVVNGRNGSVNSGQAPASNAGRVTLLAAEVVVLAAVAALLLWLGLSGETAQVSTTAGAVIVSVVAILLVWRFRLQREVEYHEPFSS
jgi:DNA-directed RNA polymerase subunit RPC12/RpoP